MHRVILIGTNSNFPRASAAVSNSGAVPGSSGRGAFHPEKNFPVIPQDVERSPARRLGAEGAGMSKHTPGPWEADAWNDIRAIDGPVICAMGRSYGLKTDYTTPPKAVTKVNARLIAAAPDYHEIAPEALEIIEALLLEREGDEVLEDLAERLRAAIAKAEGRS